MNLASMIDHTALKPETTEAQIKKLCEEAIQNNFAAVCVNPCYVPLAASLLKDHTSKVCTVVGFPLGANPTKIKLAETLWCIENGAQEIDMVVNIGAIKSENWNIVIADISKIALACKDHNVLIKVILETGLLTDSEIVDTCEICKEVGVDFVKTSTGFTPVGATAHAIKLMRQAVGEGIFIKASGGIRDRQIALDMIEAGANRIGCSASLTIISGH